MNDLTTPIDTTATGAPPAPSTIVSFALKNGAGTIEVDTAKLPDEVYAEVLLQGLKALAERNMSKLTKAEYPEEAERKAAIHAKAQKNVEDMYAGKVKLTGVASPTKVSGAVMVEAMRLAKNMVKDFMKSNKIKIKHVDPKEITKAAKDLLDSDPSIVKSAEANLEARKATPVKIDLASLIKVNPDKVAKDEADKAEKAKSKPLSAAQAKKVAPRAKSKSAKPASEAAALA